MITITNISSSKVWLTFPDIHFHRELAKGFPLPVKKEDYEYMCFDPGFQTLVRGHFIKVNGLEEETQAVVVDNSTIYDAAAIKAMLTKQDVTAFAKFIPTAKAAERETAVQYAIDLGVTNNAIVTLLKKYCDVDIISAINRKHQVEE